MKVIIVGDHLLTVEWVVEVVRNVCQGSNFSDIEQALRVLSLGEEYDDECHTDRRTLSEIIQKMLWAYGVPTCITEFRDMNRCDRCMGIDFTYRASSQASCQGDANGRRYHVDANVGTLTDLDFGMVLHAGMFPIGEGATQLFQLLAGGGVLNRSGELSWSDIMAKVVDRRARPTQNAGSQRSQGQDARPMIEGLAQANWVEEVVFDYYDKCAGIIKGLFWPHVICRSDMFHIFRLCVEEVSSRVLIRM